MLQPASGLICPWFTEVPVLHDWSHVPKVLWLLSTVLFSGEILLEAWGKPLVILSLDRSSCCQSHPFIAARFPLCHGLLQRYRHFPAAVSRAPQPALTALLGTATPQHMANSLHLSPKECSHCCAGRCCLAGLPVAGCLYPRGIQERRRTKARSTSWYNERRQAVNGMLPTQLGLREAPLAKPSSSQELPPASSVPQKTFRSVHQAPDFLP